MRKLFALFAIVGCIAMADLGGSKVWQANVCYAATDNDQGSYIKTSQTVTVQSESGVNKGTFSVYLHNGKKHIKFQNTWVCIQGARSFVMNSVRYYIK